MTRNQFAAALDALAYVVAGNATITLQSKATGTRFTYRIRVSKDGNVHFVSLMNGPDNENSYAYFGYIRRGVFFHGGAKAKVGRDAPSAKAFEWTFQKLSANDLPNSLEIWHEGSCGRCGRKLTVPSSIKAGIGPECEKHVQHSFRTEEVTDNEYPTTDPRNPDFYMQHA